ncbi:MAG: O-antigen ligase family protein [Chloroflexi bacterium]|nr:O-antigen ligase family protein [Chloroflexota bacterium]
MSAEIKIGKLYITRGDLVLAVLVIPVALAIALLPTAWIVLGMIGTGLFAFVLLRPQYAVALLAFMVPFGTLRGMTVSGFTVGGTEMLIALLAFAWYARMVADREIRIVCPPIAFPLVFLLVIMVASVLASTAAEPAVKEIIKWGEVLFVCLFVANVVDREAARWLVLGLLVAGTLEGLYGIYQFGRSIGPEEFVLFGRFMRASGHFYQPNPFGGYMGLTLPLAYGLLLAGLSTTHEGRPTAVTWAAAVVGCTVMGAALVMSWSRGAWLGFGVAALAVTLAHSRRTLLLGLLGLVLIGLFLLLGDAALLPESLIQRVVDFVPYLSGVDIQAVEVTDANFAILERLAHWKAAWDMFSDHPWFGVGIGNYPVVYERYAIPRWQDPLGHAHNYYLNTLAEMGLVGLGAYVLFVGAALATAWKAVRCSQGYWHGVALGAFGMFMHLSVHNFFDNLYVHSMGVQVGLLLGVIWLICRRAET